MCSLRVAIIATNTQAFYAVSACIGGSALNEVVKNFCSFGLRHDRRSNERAYPRVSMSASERSGVGWWWFHVPVSRWQLCKHHWLSELSNPELATATAHPISASA